MNYSIQMGSCDLIYKPRYIKIGSAIQNLMVMGTHTQIQKRQQSDLMSLHLFF
jgi:hypothetical protein